jgi:hypothetical protein
MSNIYRKKPEYVNENSHSIYNENYRNSENGKKKKNKIQKKYIERKNKKLIKKFFESGVSSFKNENKLLKFGIKKLFKFVNPLLNKIYIGFTHAHCIDNRKKSHLKSGYSSFKVFAKLKNSFEARLLEKLIICKLIKIGCILFNKNSGGGGSIKLNIPACCYFCTK